MTPFLKWPGGKRKLAESILAELPVADIYVEPFLGAGAVALLALHQNKYGSYLLSDADPDLIATWRAVQQDVDGVLAYLDALMNVMRTANSNEARERMYYAIREDFRSQLGDDVATAARLIVLNRFGYNGLYRKSAKSGFNVPFGKFSKDGAVTPYWRKKINGITDMAQWEAKLRAVSALLNSAPVRLECCGFESIGVPRNAVGFYDPPYWPRQGGGFTQYTAEGFDEQDQQDLAEHFKAQPGFCLQTNGPGAKHLYADLPYRYINEPTVVGQKAVSRGAAVTLLIPNRKSA